MADASRVFVSYSHDSEDHVGLVLALADALRTNGIDVVLDQYVHPAPAQGWPRWMEQNLDVAQFVLMICTETYRRRVMGLEEPDKGLGGDWEGNLIYNKIYSRIGNDQPSGSRFIPILLPGSEPAHIPDPIRGHSYYRCATFDLTDPGYEALYRHLTGQPATPQPDLGVLTILPPKPRPRPSPGPQSPSGEPTTNGGGNQGVVSQAGEGFRYDAYISYVDREPDTTYVWDTLVPRLKQAGLKIAVSNDSADPGVFRVVGVERGIRESKRAVIVLSEAYLADHMADFENVLGQTMGVQEGTYRLLPVKIAPIDEGRLPTRLSMLTTLDLTHPHRAEREFERLVKALQGPLPTR